MLALQLHSGSLAEAFESNRCYWNADTSAGFRPGFGVPTLAENQAGSHDPLLWDHLPGFCGAPHHQSTVAALQQSAPHAGAYCSGLLANLAPLFLTDAASYGQILVGICNRFCSVTPDTAWAHMQLDLAPCTRVLHCFRTVCEQCEKLAGAHQVKYTAVPYGGISKKTIPTAAPDHALGSKQHHLKWMDTSH